MVQLLTAHELHHDGVDLRGRLRGYLTKLASAVRRGVSACTLLSRAFKATLNSPREVGFEARHHTLVPSAQLDAAHLSTSLG